MGRMKELFMDQQEAQGYNPHVDSDGPLIDAEEKHLQDLYYAELAEELAMWEAVAADYDNYMESVRESGLPIHLVEMYGYPAGTTSDDQDEEELPF